MMLTKTKATIYGLVILATGYVAGALMGNPEYDENLLDGDIKKARIYNNAAGVSRDLGGGNSAVADKLLNDSAFQTEMIASLVFLNSRVIAVDSLANATLAATDGGGGLETLNSEMNQLAGLTGNACKAFDTFMQATETVLGGNPVKDYDVLLSNAQLAFFAVDNQVTDCSGVVNELMAANGGNYKTLAGDWVRFGAENALIGSSDEALDYWTDKYNEFFPGGGGDVTTALGKSIMAKADNTKLGMIFFNNKANIGSVSAVLMGKQAETLGMKSASTLNMNSAKSTLGKNSNKALNLKQNSMGFLFFFF